MNAHGFNSIHGLDVGPPPPGLRLPSSLYSLPPYSFPQPGYQVFPNQFPPQYQAPYQQYQQSPQFQLQPHFQQTSQFPISVYPNQGAINLQNPAGAVPGYNYMFPEEHCPIHVLKVPTPPWHLTSLIPSQLNHVKLMVPTIITIRELMKQLGCNNPIASKNTLHQVVELANGKWARGLMINGSQKDRVNMTIREIGWGRGGKSRAQGPAPVVWLWLTKDDDFGGKSDGGMGKAMKGKSVRFDQSWTKD